jgi:hypothetical protein
MTLSLRWGTECRRPVFSCPDPIRGEQHVLVLCEVLNSDGTPHRTNSRAALQQVVDSSTGSAEPLFGFEQVSRLVNVTDCTAFNLQLPSRCGSLLSLPQVT